MSHKLQTSNISQQVIRRLDDGDGWYDTDDRWDEKHLKHTHIEYREIQSRRNQT